MKQQREGTEQERLVGRKEEVRRVLDIVERVQSNVQRGAAVLVTGEAGIGKTEFADHLRRSLKLRGHAILECTCRPRDDRPNGVFIELFARGIQLVSDGGHSAEPLERALDVLSGMVPRAQRANGRPTSDAMFLRETVRRALAQVRAPGVPVVIIRDLHHADETTLNVIAYLFENLLTDPAFDWTRQITHQTRPRRTLFEALFSPPSVKRQGRSVRRVGDRIKRHRVPVPLRLKS